MQPKNIDELIKLYKKNNNLEKKDTSADTIKQAYNFIDELYADERQKEEINRQSLYIACHMLDWRHSAENIAAAILYRVMFISSVKTKDIVNIFNTETTKILKDAVKLNNKLCFLSKSNGWENITNDKDILKLIRGVGPHIIIVDYMYRLDNISDYDEAGADEIVEYAKNNLIPISDYLEAYKLRDELEDRIFNIEHNEYDIQITQAFDKYARANFVRCDETVLMFENLFLKGKAQKEDEIFPPELDIYKSFIADFVCEPRSHISIYRQITKNSENIENDFNRFLNKKNIAFYNLTLTFHNITDGANRELKPYDIFFKYYDAYLRNKDICILDYNMTSNDEYRFFLLCDGYDNLYRLFIRTTSSYSHYLVGKRLDIEDDEAGTDNISKDEIKIFKRNGDGFNIERGATALDLAFRIHTELGYHAEFAYINDKKESMGYVLKDGDRVKIEENPDVEPKLSWFRNVKTKSGINRLIEYFSDKIQSS